MEKLSQEWFPLNSISPHTSEAAVITVTNCGSELLSDPVYSPDLAPSNLSFPNVKENLLGKNFIEDNEVTSVVEGVWGHAGQGLLEDRHNQTAAVLPQMH